MQKGNNVLHPTETLADYVASARFSSFPQEVLRKAKYCILDSVGCALGSAQTALGKQYIDLARSFGGKPESILIGDNTKVSMINAAYTNTQLANLTDFDDTQSHPYHAGHPGGPIVNSSLAVGEVVGASGEEILSAVIVGYEVSLRIARALHSVCEIGGVRDVIINSGHKVFGAAAPAARLLGLSTEQIINAFGIAGDSVPGTSPSTSRQTGLPPKGVASAVKGNFGIYSGIGLFAVLQAQKGLTGIDDILDKDLFWTKSGATSCNYVELTRDLGEKYEIMRVGFKPTPSCRWTHGAITAVWEALKGETVAPEDIEEITLIGKPSLPFYDWETMLEAEFSTPCAVAMAIAGGEPGPRWYTSGRFKAKDIRELAQKIKFLPDPEADDIFVKYSLTRSTAEVKTKDGKIMKGHCNYMKGEPENPFTKADFHRKFMVNSVGVMGEKQAEELWQTLLRLEEVEDISAVTSLLGPSNST